MKHINELLPGVVEKIMECPRGSECADREHEVKTLAKARDWYRGCKDEHLPVRISQKVSANGRIAVKVYAFNGDLIHARG